MADTLHVLIVDTDPNLRRRMSRALADLVVHLPDLGEVTFCPDAVDHGAAALDWLGQHPVDLLLIDHHLPDLEGLQLLRQVKQQRHDLEVVMVMANATVALAVSAGREGAFDFLAKPFTPQELRTTIEKAAAHLVAQRRARELAKERHQLRFQLISVVAHELKAPLNAIDSYLHLLHEPGLKIDEKNIEHVISRCMFRLDGMRKLINDLLDLTRIESGQKQRHVIRQDIIPAVHAALDDARQAAKDLDLQVEADLPRSLEMTIDDSELTIILNNLLSNAVKYNRPDGKVHLTVRDLDEQVQFIVSDTGIGMTEEEAGRLFQEFVRIINSKTRRIPGSGLGLSTVKKVAALYDGRVELQSQPDVGSTFTVTLQKHLTPNQNVALSEVVA